MTSKLLPLFLLPAVLLASCGGDTAPTKPTSNTVTPPAPVPTNDVGSQTRSADEQSVFEQVNAVRSKGADCGSKKMPPVPPLTWNGYLAAAAAGHAKDMADNGYFAHKSLDGRTVGQRATAAGYLGWVDVGENLAVGYGPLNVVQFWLNSPSHCEAMLDSIFNEVGLNYLQQPGSKYGAYWVMDMGIR